MHCLATSIIFNYEVGISNRTFSSFVLLLATALFVNVNIASFLIIRKEVYESVTVASYM